MIASDMVATRSEVAGENGVVAGGHMAEAEAGIAVLRAGGNAIDALVAAAFVGYVVEPAQCGIGGYGHLSLFHAPSAKLVSVDHYARAPAAARADMFEIDRAAPLKYYGFPHTKGMRAERGHMAPAVPGAVSGLCAAQAMFGKLRLAQVLDPAIQIARAGVPITWNLLLTIAARLDEIRLFPHTAAWLLRDGRPPAIAGQLGGGDRLDTRDLAATLERVAAQGPAGFYDGPVAAAIERELIEHGGMLRASDLASYRPRILVEEPQRYRGLEYISCFDQVTYEALNILETFDLAAHGPDSLAFRHLMAEALGCAYIDSMTHYGDPDFTRSPVMGLASPRFARERARGLSFERALPRPLTPADPWPYDGDGARPERVASAPTIAKLAGTSQMAAADREGNMAALCTSITSGLGSLVRVPGVGVLLNNAMQNFDPRPEQANCIAPGKMPIFGAPALVATKDGRARFGSSGSGGYRITTGVLHSLVHVVDFGLGLQAGIDAPRVHCQGGETIVDARIAPAIRERMAAMGHKIVVQRDDPGLNAFGRVASVSRDDMLRAASGPAWASAAAAW